MRARMSSDRRIGRLPSHPLRYETSLSEPAATFMDSLALDEARSILADAEPTDPMWSAHLTARGILPWNERRALAESLRSFVEGN